MTSTIETLPARSGVRRSNGGQFVVRAPFRQGHSRYSFPCLVWCAAATLGIGSSSSGCATSLGYAVGSSIDDRHARLEFQGGDAVRAIAPAERVRLRCRDRSQKEGTFVGIQTLAATGSAVPLAAATFGPRGDRGVVLFRQTPSAPTSAVPIGDISAVGQWHRSKTATTIGVLAGVLIDVAVVILIARSSFQLGNIGPIK